MKFLFSLSLLVLVFGNIIAQDSLKKVQAYRLTIEPKIDGILDDDVWKKAIAVSDFIQNMPYQGAAATQKTEVRIAYDDAAIYVGAMMYETAPDSILQELGNRDDQGLNADKFRFVIDPYLKMQDAYEFSVYASGVQTDTRFSDWTYNGIWYSAVKILDNGWSVEMKIPYFTIRFPSTEIQKWGLQFTRDIRRTRTFEQWCLTPGGQANPQKFWGTLEGISGIKSPLRLSLTPYLSGYLENAPIYNSNGSTSYSTFTSYNAGADIKYGIDERFTLDMTLLPDFGQVQSDNKVKNLSYQEVVFEEFRPFFKEDVDLFNRDQLFYSRRVGRTPTNFYAVNNLLLPGEQIEKNPSRAKLLNATKISGRGNKGLALGIFNAVTDDTYAEINDSTGKHSRKILTEPLTNYNAVVLDQQLKNASNIYLINTNVTRKGREYRDANVTGTGFSFQDKTNTWALLGSANLSQILTIEDTNSNKYRNITGFFYNTGISKISGKWQYFLGREVMSNTFERKDMGFQAINNYVSYNSGIGFNLFQPWKFLLRSRSNFNFNYSHNYLTGLPTNVNLNINLWGVSRKNWGMWWGATTSPVSNFDYFEPRVAGKYFRTAEWYYTWIGFSTNYQYRFAVDMSVNTANFYSSNIHNFPRYQGYGAEIKPRFRVNDKLSFYSEFNYGYDPYNPGFSTFDDNGNPVFGGRRLNTFTNTLRAKYIFVNNMSLTLVARHYWSTGEYLEYFSLLDNGLLAPYPTYTGNNNFSYNAFNIDAVFSWVFSPGSLFSIVYKNAIEQNGQVIPRSYSDNFSSTIESPQTNSISLRVLYFLNYDRFKKKKK